VNLAPVGLYIEQLKIPLINLVLYLFLYTCFAFYCISAVLRYRCWLCRSVLTATIINEHYYHYSSKLTICHTARSCATLSALVGHGYRVFSENVLTSELLNIQLLIPTVFEHFCFGPVLNRQKCNVLDEKIASVIYIYIRIS